MPNINLIRDQRIATKQLETKTKLSLIALMASSTISLGFFGFQVIQTKQVEGDLAKVIQQHKEIDPLVKATEENMNKLAVLRPKVDTLTSAEKATRRWTRIMDYIATNTPPTVWLTQLRSIRPTPVDQVNMTLTGMSSNNALASEALTRLQANRDFDGVSLNYTSEDVSTTHSGIKFELTARVAGTAEPLPKEKEGSKT
ncbi:MAG: PilN domain-containing protein [Armatimonadetes bacterium]|nr:PilN domain-containing protein [Armatimonadota bacterium]